MKKGSNISMENTEDPRFNEQFKEDKEPRKGLKFNVVDGDGSYTDPNWLENLGIFTVFVSREKPTLDRTTGRYTPKAIDLKEYHVVNRYGRATKLKMLLPGSPPVDIWVDTYRFSTAMEKVEVLYEPND